MRRKFKKRGTTVGRIYPLFLDSQIKRLYNSIVGFLWSGGYMYKKTLDEMILKDDFLFGAVMSQEELCREFLELVLGFPVERVEVDREKSLVYNPQQEPFFSVRRVIMQGICRNRW